MAFKLTWKPVLQALALRDYHPDYGENVIMVCVNPQPEFLQERATLMEEYSKRFADIKLAEAKLTAARTTGKEDAELALQFQEQIQAFNTWMEQVFVETANDWFARLWSFGADQFTGADLKQYDEIDPHFLTWLKNRSMDMIDEHRQGKKKV